MRIWMIICFCVPMLATAQQDKLLVNEGNILYKDSLFAEAQTKYEEAQLANPDRREIGYNLGNSLYRQEKLDEAAPLLEQYAKNASTKLEQAKGYHNLGNTYLKKGELEKGIDAYKNALRQNPKSDESRYNLAYAQQMLKKQQEQEKKDDKKEDKKDNKEEEEKKDEEKKQDEEQKEEEKKDEEQQEQEEKEQEQEEKQEQRQENQISKQKAEQILEALNNDEKAVQQKVKRNKGKGKKIVIEKDW
jgi:Ca-activated chloride channel family protein